MQFLVEASRNRSPRKIFLMGNVTALGERLSKRAIREYVFECCRERLTVSMRRRENSRFGYGPRSFRTRIADDRQTAGDPGNRASAPGGNLSAHKQEHVGASQDLLDLNWRKKAK